LNLIYPPSQKALDTLGFSDEDVVLIFKIVASVLKLGNIGFTPTSNIDGTEGCTVSNDYGIYFFSLAPQPFGRRVYLKNHGSPELFEVCGLLGTNPMELHSALTQRTIIAGPVLDSPSTNLTPPPPPPTCRGVKSGGGCTSPSAGTPPSFVPSSSMSSSAGRGTAKFSTRKTHQFNMPLLFYFFTRDVRFLDFIFLRLIFDWSV
jgi:hypothetical protein